MPQVVGLDIGATSVKAALFERGFRGLELTGFHKVEFDAGDPEGVGRALDEVARRLQAGNAAVVCRVPGDRVLLRILDLPMSDARKLEQVIPFEVEQLIPYELDEVVLDHSILRRTPEGGSRVLVAVAKKEELRKTLDLLAPRQLDPRMMAAGAASLGSLVAALPALAEGTVALVDAGFARTDVCILDGGRIAFARTISAGWADIVDAHVAGGGASEELGAFDVAAVARPDSAASHAAAEYVAREIRRTLLSAETESGVYVDRLVLFGGLAQTRGFAALLERVSGTVVEPLSIAGADWAKAGLGGATDVEAGAAIALAFRVVSDGPSAAVNFRKDEFAFRRDAKELSGVVSRVLAVGMVVLALAIVHYVVKERLLASERKALDKEIAAVVLDTFPDVPKDRLSSPDTAISIMRGNMADARTRLEQLGSGDAISALDVLREFSDAVPAGTYIDVKKFSFQEGKVQVQCIVDSYEASDKLVEALKKVNGFTAVESSGGGNDPSGKRKVTIGFQVGTAEPAT